MRLCFEIAERSAGPRAALAGEGRASGSGVALAAAESRALRCSRVRGGGVRQGMIERSSRFGDAKA
jgi:hypothetical protein